MSTIHLWLPGQEPQRALFEAYVAESGLPISPSHLRKQALREMDRRGLTSDDVRAVVRGIKAHIARGTHGYTDASLDWRNAMGDVDTFEERALKARQAKLRNKGRRAAPIVAQTRTLGAGETVTVLAPQPVDRPPINLRAAAEAEIAKAKRKTLEGGHAS